MKRFLLVIILMLMTAGSLSPVKAHDIGVSETELVEREGGRYLLRVRSGFGATHLFPPPRLPAQCDFAGNPRGSLNGEWKSFEFSCTDVMTAADSIVLPWRRDGVMLTVTWLNGTKAKQLFSNVAGLITVPLSELKAGSGSWVQVAKRYTALGIEHILLGIDHLLFVLGLLFLVRGGMQLIKTITAFTVAHSITLALATFGVVNVPARPVDAIVALSIVFLGAEILYARQGRIGLSVKYPWLVSFGFGLIHGLGFAGALTGIGIPTPEIPPALLFFNVGVEIGQLMFVLIYLGIIWSFKQLEVKIPSRLEPVPAYVIGGIATYWFIGRAALIFT